MPEYADIYVLGRERSPEVIARFLDRFLPSRCEVADDYEVPQFSETPQKVFKTADELIHHCCRHSKEGHRIYWRSNVRDEFAEVHFLEDGGLIFGVSTPAQSHSRVDAVSSELERFFETDEIFVTYEDLPPDNVEAFKTFLASLPRLVDVTTAEASRGARAHRPIKF